jgi:KRAB domain-containing zinc finger protein
MLRVHTEEVRFICDHCGKGFRVKHDMKDHMQTHMSVESRQKYPCSSCKSVFLSKSAMKNHEQIFHSQIIEEHPCDCGKVFESKIKLYQHRTVVHMKGHYPCQSCGKVYTQKNVLQKHILRNHTTKVPCEVCGKMFAPGMFMKKHLKSHGPKQHKCTIDRCGKEFHSKTALAYHVDSQHKPVENVKCPSCDASFTSTRNLNRHVTRQHNNYRVQCKIEGCTHTASRKDYLAAHYRSHKEIDEETRAQLLEKVRHIKVIPW